MIWLICDGGKTPAKAYGSYLILSGPTLSQAVEVEHKQQDFPEASTNNEAEYVALIKGLEALRRWELKRVKIIMDSQVVLNQVTAEWNVNAENLVPLCERAIELLGEFEEVSTELVGRDTIVHYLGH